MYCNKQTGFSVEGTQIIILSKKEMIIFFLFITRYLVVVFACFVSLNLNRVDSEWGLNMF